jgi:hypothetical protein
MDTSRRFEMRTMRSTSMRRLRPDNEMISTQAPWWRGQPRRRAGGKGLMKYCVDAIHRGEVSHLREKHTGAQ